MSKGNNKINCEESVISISRREFLGGVGIVAGGVTIASMPITLACKSKETSIYTSSSSSTQPTMATNAGSYSTTFGIYVPPSEAPPLLDFPGLTSTVATDRLYSYEHIWIKPISSNLVVLGVTDKLQALMGSFYQELFYCLWAQC
jgi:hypothetical protein